MIALRSWWLVRRTFLYKLFCICILWRSSGVIHGQWDLCFLVVWVTLGAISFNAAVNLSLHSILISLIPLEVKVAMWRSSASSRAPGFGLPVVHFRLVIVLRRCCVFPLRIAAVQLTSAWSVNSTCSTRASGICVRFVSIKSRHLAEFALIRVGSATMLPRERREVAEWRCLRLWSVLLIVSTLKSPSKKMSLPSRPSVMSSKSFQNCTLASGGR